MSIDDSKISQRTTASVELLVLKEAYLTISSIDHNGISASSFIIIHCGTHDIFKTLRLYLQSCHRYSPVQMSETCKKHHANIFN